MDLQVEITEPQIRVVQIEGNYGKFAAEPLERGYGVTLGNALRRVLLSSLPGAAVTSVRIDQVQHEFAAIPHVKEDVMEFLLNVKQIRLRALSERPGRLLLEAQGEGRVTAADLKVFGDFEIVNPELHLATLDSPDARLTAEFTVEVGRGYRPAQSDGQGVIGVIPVDAIFSPVRKVNYTVENVRVGQITNYERLVLEVWTDGTITPQDAVAYAAEILERQFARFKGVGRAVVRTTEARTTARVLPPHIYELPIEELNLSLRTYNALKRANITKVGEAVERSDEELLAIRNFGRKSLEELRQRLREKGYLPDEGELAGSAPLTYTAYPDEPEGDEEE